ncbi:MAG: hypothetical protein Q9187_006898, partial [Circinaria calcarea]
MDTKHTTISISSLDADLGPQPTQTRSFLERLRLHFLLALLVTLFLISLTALLYLALPSTMHSFSFNRLTPTDLFCPPLHATTFNEHPIYKSLSPGSDAAWEALVPENGGFILQTEKGKDGEQKMGISMFHQLHCLVMLRGWIRELKAAANATFAVEVSGSAMPMSMSIDTNPETPEDAPDFREVHLLHCLDYLRQ